MKRREVSWTLKRSQKRSRAGRWSWALRVGLLLPQLSLNSSATDIVFVTLLHTAVETAIDDLRKSRGLHSVSSYRHGLYIYKSMPAGVAITVSTWAR